MKLIKIIHIAAIDEARGLGYKNKLLFHIPADLKRFKKITLGFPVLMGRKTFESIGKPLPGRLNMVISKNKDLAIAGAVIFMDINKAIDYIKKQGHTRLFIIGGGEIYNQTIKMAATLYLTIVKGRYQADTFYPEYTNKFKLVSHSEWQKFGNLEYKFVTYKALLNS